MGMQGELNRGRYRRAKLGDRLDQVIDLVNELRSDTSAGATDYNDLVTELKTSVNELKTLTDELRTDHGTFKTAIDALKAYVQNQITTGTPAVAIATTTTKVQLAANIEYTINGVGYAKTATDDFWTLTGGVLADGDVRGYYLLIDSAGAASVQATDDQTSAGALTWPTPTADRCIVGTLLVATSGATFTPASTALSAAEVTDTYNDGLSLAAALAAVLPDPPATITAAAATDTTASIPADLTSAAVDVLV